MPSAIDVLLILGAQDRASSVFSAFSRNLSGVQSAFSSFNRAQSSIAALSAEVTAAQMTQADAATALATATARADVAQTALLNTNRATVTQMAQATAASLAYRDAQVAAADANSALSTAQGRLSAAQAVPSAGARLAGGAAGALAIGGAYTAYRSVKDALAYQQQITDIVSTSTQNQASIPTLQRGILNMVRPGERFNASEIAQGLYPILSNPMFSNPQDALGALRTIVQQAQGSGASSINALAQADVGATSAFGLKASQLPFVANVVQTGVNVGSAEPVDFARGVATFAASAKAAGASLQDAVGAFAQGTNLSPRFRFQAQDLNRLFVDVNKTPTGKPATVAADLGIGGDFGPGGIARAGGFANWLRAIQQATQGPNQQALLQRLFPNIASLTAIRGLTGGNFATGQERIAQTQNAGGAVARVAAVADRPAMAQLESIGARFNKDLLLMGGTISTLVVPALVTFGNRALTATDALTSSFAGLGNFLDSTFGKGTAGSVASSIAQQTGQQILTPWASTLDTAKNAATGLAGAFNALKNALPSSNPPKVPQNLRVVPAGTEGPLWPGQVRASAINPQQPISPLISPSFTPRPTALPLASLLNTPITTSLGLPTAPASPLPSPGSPMPAPPPLRTRAQQPPVRAAGAASPEMSISASIARATTTLGQAPGAFITGAAGLATLIRQAGGTVATIQQDAARTARQQHALADANGTAATRATARIRGTYPPLGGSITPGDPTARYGQVVTRMSSGNDTARDQIAKLQAQIDMLRRINAGQDQQINALNETIRQLRSGNASLSRIEANTARGAMPTPTKRSVPRRTAGAA